MVYKYDLEKIKTPAFICDIDLLIENLKFHRKLTEDCNCRLLFSLKTFTIIEILKYYRAMP